MLAMTAAAGLALTGREPWVATSVALFGATSFTFPVLVATYLRDHLHDRAFSNALGALTLIYGSALVVGPVAGGAVADSGLGIDAVFLALAVVGFFGAVAVALLPGSDPDGAVGAAEPAPSEQASS
jgi:MFS family permease